jgi:hypothetical protein
MIRGELQAKIFQNADHSELPPLNPAQGFHKCPHILEESHNAP